MANTSKEVKQRYQEAAYIEVGEAYELAGTGFEKLDEEPGAQTSSKKYINDKSSTSSITSYEGTHPFTADQILSEKVIEDFVSIGKLRKTGGDAERSLVRVDLDNVSRNRYERNGERTESILQPDETVVPTSGRHFRGRKRKTGQDHAGTSW